jgi:hypothetical protein
MHSYLKGADGTRHAGLQHPFFVDDKGDLAVTFVDRLKSLEQDFNVVKTK